MMESPSMFGATDPFSLTRTWLERASKTEPSDPNAISLATVDDEGVPNVRVVLLKEIEDDGFVFYTNYESRKGRELEMSGHAAFVLHWKTQGRQVRVRGPVSREDGPKADAYYASRAVTSRLGAWASEQSQPLRDRGELERRLEDVKSRFGDSPPRPPFWGGFRLRPSEFEFWEDGDFRLHNRERWTRDCETKGWTLVRLFP